MVFREAELKSAMLIARDSCPSTRRPRVVRAAAVQFAVALHASMSAYCSGELATVGVVPLEVKRITPLLSEKNKRCPV